MSKYVLKCPNGHHPDHFNGYMQYSAPIAVDEEGQYIEDLGEPEPQGQDDYYNCPECHEECMFYPEDKEFPVEIPTIDIPTIESLPINSPFDIIGTV